MLLSLLLQMFDWVFVSKSAWRINMFFSKSILVGRPMPCGALLKSRHCMKVAWSLEIEKRGHHRGSSAYKLCCIIETITFVALV
jgi:hypothetical protein